MTPKKIYSVDPSVREKVLEAYPVTKKEKNCALEKARMEGKRAELAKRLYGEKQKIEISDEPNKLFKGSIVYK